MKKKFLMAMLVVFGGTGLFASTRYVLLQRKFEPIKASARAYIIDHSSEPCGTSDMHPVAITNQWASIRVIPDMKTCITDPCWVIMKKVGGKWEGFTLGTCCFIDVPEELFQGEAEDWPEPIEEDKARYREEQRFKGR